MGTNLYASGAGLAEYLAKRLNGKGKVLMMTGIPGVSTSDIMEAGGKATFKKYPGIELIGVCLLYTSPSPRDRTRSRMPSSA